MRACFLAYKFYETAPSLMQFATTLARQGDIVDVFALRRKGQARNEILDGVNVHRIQIRTVNEQRRLTYVFRILRFFFVSALALMRRHILRPYQLVHIQSVPDFLVFGAALAKLTRAAIILDMVDIVPEFYASKFNAGQGSIGVRLLLLIEKWSVAFSSHVIVPNGLWYQRLLTRSVRPEKCSLIRYLPDPRMFFPRPKRETDKRFLIVYPGTLNWHQGLDIAIKAFARVLNQIPEAEFHIYGEGPAKPHLLRLTKLLNLDGKVRFEEMVPKTKLPELIAGYDLAVVPKRASSSFGNEAESTKILEFMAVGVPVIVARTRIDAYYHSEKTVKFFESENETDLANCVLLLRRNHDLRHQMVANAVEYFQENNWEAVKPRYLSLVDHLVAERSHS